MEQSAWCGLLAQGLVSAETAPAMEAAHLALGAGLTGRVAPKLERDLR